MIRWIKIVRMKGIKKNSMLVGQAYLPFIASRLIVCLGLDPDYVEYLKLKKQKAVEAQSAMSEEQMQSRFVFPVMIEVLSIQRCSFQCTMLWKR